MMGGPHALITDGSKKPISNRVNEIISNVSDKFINAGLKLDNSGSIKAFVSKDSYGHTKLISQAHSKNIHISAKSLFNSQTEF